MSLSAMFIFNAKNVISDVLWNEKWHQKSVRFLELIYSLRWWPSFYQAVKSIPIAVELDVNDGGFPPTVRTL